MSIAQIISSDKNPQSEIIEHANGFQQYGNTVDESPIKKGDDESAQTNINIFRKQKS